MTRAEANIIFRAWQDYLEVGDKFRQIMLTPPASLLPYPVDIIESALNIIAKDCFDSGDKIVSEEIQRLMTLHLFGYHVLETGGTLTDEEALVKMRDTLNFILENPPLKDSVLENLKSCQQSWMDMRRKTSDSEPRQFAEVGGVVPSAPSVEPQRRDWLSRLFGKA